MKTVQNWPEGSWKKNYFQIMNLFLREDLKLRRLFGTAQNVIADLANGWLNRFRFILPFLH